MKKFENDHPVLYALIMFLIAIAAVALLIGACNLAEWLGSVRWFT